MRQLDEWADRCGRALRAAAVAADPGEDGVVDEDEVLDDLDQELRRDFTDAATALARARWRQQVKDTPGHRFAVLETARRVDALLDMYLLHLELRPGLPAAAAA